VPLRDDEPLPVPRIKSERRLAADFIQLEAAE
jgi:hypothetical protein